MSTFHERFVQAFRDEVSRRQKNNEPRLTKSMVWRAAKATSGAFTHWFNGENGMDLDKCELVAPLLRVSPHWLFYGTGRKDDFPRLPVSAQEPCPAPYPDTIMVSGEEKLIVLGYRKLSEGMRQIWLQAAKDAVEKEAETTVDRKKQA